MASKRRSVDVLKTGRLVAFGAAGLILVAAFLDVLLFAGVTAGPPEDPFFFDWGGTNQPAQRATSLSHDFLVRSWSWNLRAFPSLLTSDLLLSLGLFGVAYVAWVLTKAYRAAGGLAAKIMLLFFALGALVPSVGFLQNLGSTTAGNRIFSDWVAPGNQYAEETTLVALQLAYLMSVGRSVWIQALLYVLLGCGFGFCGYLGLVHSSEQRSNRLPRGFRFHAFLSFAAGVTGFVVFIVDEIKFFNVNFYAAYGVATVVYLVLLVPAWCVWLGLLLPQVPSEFMRGVVVVRGPAYAELGGVRRDEMSVEMEESSRSASSVDNENVVEDDGGVVEIKL